MARISGITRDRAGLILRTFYRIVERMLGRLPEPLVIQALARPVLQAVVSFEALFGRARRVPEQLKILAQIEVARQTGCPF